MHNRLRALVRSWWFAPLAVAVLLSHLGPASSAAGQEAAADPSARAVAADPPEVSRWVAEGQLFEQQQRWLDALSHYDSAVRELPDSQTLRLRRTLAHIHVDIDRRHVDSSYKNFVRQTSEQDALNIYWELCLKVQSNYVHEPNWQRVAWRGTANLDVAVTVPEFQRDYLPAASAQQVADFRSLLRQDVNKRLVRSRSEARALAAYCAGLAQERLGLNSAAVLGEYCAGAIASLDEYSTFLTSDQLDDVYSQIKGNFVGLGIELKASDDALLIVRVIPGGPAHAAGIQAGQRIVAVDGKSTSEVSSEKAADLLRGPEGSLVTIGVQADDGVRQLQVRRERVEVPSVEQVGIIDPQYRIAYFRLNSFQETTSREVDEALWELHRNGMRSLIIDVRGNPGGLLTSSVEVADKFIEDGTLVSTRGRSPREDFDYKAHRVGTWRVPLLVLIDQDTASASEIFAGAVRDHGRGTVLGQRSYGKGSVQGIFPLSSSTVGVRLTTAKFYSPNGTPISQRGVEPHRQVQVMARPVAVDSDGLLPPQDAAGTDWQRDAVILAAVETARQTALANRNP